MVGLGGLEPPTSPLSGVLAERLSDDACFRGTVQGPQLATTVGGNRCSPENRGKLKDAIFRREKIDYE